MDIQEEKNNFSGAKCLLVPVTICVINSDEEDPLPCLAEDVKEAEPSSTEPVKEDLPKAGTSSGQEKRKKFSHWLVDFEKFQHVQKSASKITPDGIVRRTVLQKKNLFSEKSAELPSQSSLEDVVEKGSSHLDSSDEEGQRKLKRKHAISKQDRNAVKTLTEGSEELDLGPSEIIIPLSAPVKLAEDRNIPKDKDFKALKTYEQHKREDETVDLQQEADFCASGQEIQKSRKGPDELVEDECLCVSMSPRSSFSLPDGVTNPGIQEATHSGEGPPDLYCRRCKFSTNDMEHFIQHVNKHPRNSEHRGPPDDKAQRSNEQLLTPKRRHRHFTCDSSDCSAEELQNERHKKTPRKENVSKKDDKAAKDSEDSAKTVSREIGSKVTEEIKRTIDSNIAEVNGKQLTCHLCKVTFHKAYQLENHKKVHLNSNTFFNCDHCDYTTHLSYNLKCHSMIHTGEKPFRCNSCECSFRLKSHLSRHKSVHLRIKTEGQEIKSEEKMPSISQEHDSSDEDSKLLLRHAHTCDVCQYSTSSSYNLKCHKRIHTGEKPYQCKECNHSFRHLSHLNRHKRVHVFSETVNPSKSKKSNQQDNTHCKTEVCSKVHTHSCEKCNYSTDNAYNLKVHLRTHTDERPYRCRNCDAAFRTQSHLYRHERTLNKVGCKQGN
ncbi:zinc finger protein 117 isoform X2 [Amia ocellicauda]